MKEFSVWNYNFNPIAKVGGTRLRMSTTRGMALLFTLSVGALLVILAASLFALYSSDVHSQHQQHQSMQAYWFARAGVERYSDSRRLPPEGRYDFSPHGYCRVLQQGPDLIFEGLSGKQHCRILLHNGDPAHKVEQP